MIVWVEKEARSCNHLLSRGRARVDNCFNTVKDTDDADASLPMPMVSLLDLHALIDCAFRWLVVPRLFAKERGRIVLVYQNRRPL